MRIAQYFYHAWIAAAWFALSCTPHPKPPAPRPTAPAPEAPLWPVLKQIQSWPKLQYEITSGGHSGQPYVAEVHVDSIPTMQSYQQLSTGSELPVGTTIVQLHRDEQGAAGPIYVMEKSQTGWTFSELDPLGHLLREGALANCARCHAEGVADSLFGPLRVQQLTP